MMKERGKYREEIFLDPFFFFFSFFVTRGWPSPINYDHLIILRSSGILHHRFTIK
jgi:hypothetical protein